MIKNPSTRFKLISHSSYKFLNQKTWTMHKDRVVIVGYHVVIVGYHKVIFMGWLGMVSA